MKLGSLDKTSDPIILDYDLSRMNKSPDERDHHVPNRALRYGILEYLVFSVTKSLIYLNLMIPPTKMKVR